MTEVESGVWYKATGYESGEWWYNVFFEFSEDTVKYLSVGPVSSATFYVEFIEASYDEFEDNILDNYEFVEKKPSSGHSQIIIKGIFK